MKLQLQTQALRLRIDEGELAELLAGGTLTLQLGPQDRRLLNLMVTLGADLQFGAEPSGPWRLQLPAAELRAYVDTLPRRDALALPLTPDLHLDFEVDVRDSLRARGAKPRRDRTSISG